MDNICSTCLSKDRTLTELGTLRSVYQLLIPDGGIEAMTGVALPETKVCWECRRLLNKCDQFQRNALAARDVLVAYTLEVNETLGHDIQQSTYSTLGLKGEVEYTHVCHEDDKPIVPIASTSKALVRPISVKKEKNIETNYIEFETNLKVESRGLTDDDDSNGVVEPNPEANADPLSVTATAAPVKTFNVPVVKFINNKKVQMISKDQLPKNLIPISGIPFKSKTSVVKQLKLSDDMIKQMQALAANKMPLQLKVGGETLSNVIIVNNPKSVEKVAVKKDSKAVKKVVKKKAKVPKKPGPKTGSKLKMVGCKVTGNLYHIEDDDETPTFPEIRKRFTDLLQDAITHDQKRLVNVVVMDDSELSAYRQSEMAEPQYCNSEFKCERCIVGYYSQQQLDDHNKAKHTHRAVDTKCPICLSYVPSYLFAFHYGRHRVLYKCVLCDAAVKDVRRVREHLNKHKNNMFSEQKRSFACRECGQKFDSKHRRKVHTDQEHQPQQQYACDVCGKTFRFRWSYRDHVKRHAMPQQPVECHVCHKTYKTIVSFTIHYKNVHKRDPTSKVRCEACDMSFVNTQCLNTHLKYSRRHIDPSNFKHMCYACGKGFMFERQMKDHINFVHKGVSDYVCEHCNKMFSSAGGLRKHVRMVHEGGRYEKNRPCTVCDKSFTSPKSLREHMNIHNGVRPFKCPVCGDSFKQSAALYTHRRLVHLGYKMRNKKFVKVAPQTAVSSVPAVPAASPVSVVSDARVTAVVACDVFNHMTGDLQSL